MLSASELSCLPARRCRQTVTGFTYCSTAARWWLPTATTGPQPLSLFKSTTKIGQREVLFRMVGLGQNWMEAASAAPLWRARARASFRPFDSPPPAPTLCRGARLWRDRPLAASSQLCATLMCHRWIVVLVTTENTFHNGTRTVTMETKFFFFWFAINKPTCRQHRCTLCNAKRKNLSLRR